MPDANTTSPPAQFDAIVIGAGFAGLYQLHCLRDRLGLKVRVLEAADGIGGTWYWNRYPGARCDSESHSYCYSFSDELIRDWEWSERYPEHPEIRRYLNFVADRFDLKRDIQLGTRVAGASFDEGASRWTVRTEAGETFSAQFLITAVGCLSSANVPKIPGLEDFEGDWYHTGEWPHEGVDFAGRRVGQIGTGSTGIQAAPVIAAQAAHLTVFQRTANYSVPAHNAPLTPEFKAKVKAGFADIKRTMHSTTNGHPFVIEEQSVFDVTPEEREAIYERAWAKGGLQFRANFRDITTDMAANATAAEFIKAKIRAIVKDPATAAKLSEIDHPYAAKRPPIDSFYFETFNRENVTLEDIRADPIDRITPTGIRLQSGKEIPLDILVFATGFDAMTGPFLRMDISGRDGLTLAEAWEAGPRSYLGLNVKGFPNLFTITGPGSPSVLCNMPVPIEQHAEWIAGCIAHMRQHGIATIEATEEATESWSAEVNAAAEATLLPQASSSWYLGANVPGKPRVFMPYAGGMAKYRGICDEVAAEGYRGFELGRATVAA
ncbi:NAD(P)/FAD-dependent oxidoreductase [Roseococcus sp. SYP-B2431]|uniref:flavin-containing monooxygenase n=1 Tax=Roseococcus sp. SYP-B2431 TaxID=2496640 RepID=UPI00103B63CB|nr:NAD(P)/FAD-dependent oxidoreductase [Roseococcus sp. SYP-B2431]TCH99705.1 NAD(P)/FAD-dependent oxidoreductase [Roseococcus sp. SYP-B2431]